MKLSTAFCITISIVINDTAINIEYSMKVNLQKLIITNCTDINLYIVTADRLNLP